MKEGVKQIQPIKCISKSNPLFQEFRLWQFIKNLKIYQRELYTETKTEIDYPVTDKILKNEEDVVLLFDFLNNKKEIEQKQLLKYFNLSEKKFRWNYVEDKKYPINETRTSFLNRLNKIEDLDENQFLTKTEELDLWHLVY